MRSNFKMFAAQDASGVGWGAASEQNAFIEIFATSYFTQFSSSINCKKKKDYSKCATLHATVFLSFKCADYLSLINTEIYVA